MNWKALCDEIGETLVLYCATNEVKERELPHFKKVPIPLYNKLEAVTAKYLSAINPNICHHPAAYVMLQFETIEHTPAFFSNNYYHLCKKCDRRVKPTRYEEVKG